MLEIRRRVLPHINILKAISGIKWDTHPSVISTAYKELVRSVLDWGCQVVSSLKARKSLVIDRVQYVCIRFVCKFMRTTFTNVLLDVVNVHPLVCRRKYLTNKYVCKVIARSSLPLNSILN